MTGYIAAFNYTTLVGYVETGVGRLRFHSTSFQSDTSMRWPRVGEVVDVVLTARGDLLSLHGR